MYEASFGLKRRPFAATPDSSCFLSAAPIQAALDELVVCVQQGQGIAILTAPAGTGKTLLCERLRTELDDRYETVFLRHASFLTRRALLQTVLCELNHQYHHPSEQELRLELFPAIRALQPKREALVLICDEAHQLSDSLLEELRILADFAEAGRPLVRLVLVGQLALEEKLAQPGLEAFNQRIRAHLNLSTFDHAGSLDYIDYRVTWAGGRTDEVFTPAALDLIASVSDGVPRCINQLADHTLLLAFVAEQKPAGEELVREALGDLRQLPLHWNEPPQSLSSIDHSDRDLDDISVDLPTLQELEESLRRDSSGDLSHSKAAAMMYSFEPESGDDTEVIEVPAELTSPVAAESESRGPSLMTHETAAHLESTDVNRVEVGSADWQQTVEMFISQPEVESHVDCLTDPISESAAAENEVDVQSAFKRRIDFHSLVQDTYNSASELPISTVDDEHESCDTCHQSAHNIEDSSMTLPANQNSGRSEESYSSIISATNPVALNSTLNFHEEVIVDRYTAIDAGFEPPVMPTFDTSHVAEVRQEKLPVQTFSVTTSSPAVTTSSPRANFEVDRAHGLPRDRSAENVAAEVYSLGESLRPNDSLSSSSESILKTLRQEVEGIEAWEDSESITDASTTTSTASWDAIETPAPPPVVESRPFRYLFSRLRRKQQGLS